MVREILKIYTDNGLGDNNPTFKDIELTEYNAKFPRMGFPDLTATLMWSACLDDEWTGKEYVELRGERFYIKDTPHSEKSNTDARWKHEIEFTSEFAMILGNKYFVDAVPSYAETYDKPCTNSSKFTFYGTISELCDRLNCAFIYAGIADSVLKTKTSLTPLDNTFDDGYCVMLDPYGAGNIYDTEKTYNFGWEDQTLWDAITEGYNITEIPFERRGRKIIFGALPKVVNHKFEYGHDNELLSIKHRNAKAKVVNRITMQGSTENIPHYYPNETEYGHINLVAKSGNNVLSTSNMQIANMTQLLSRLNADSVAVLGKYSDIPNASITIDSYKYKLSRLGSTIFVERPLEIGKYIHYDVAPSIKQVTWHIKVNFHVTSSGHAECRISGLTWNSNQTQPDKGKNMSSSVKIESLFKIGDIGGYEFKFQVQSKGTYLDLGYLETGDYYLQFCIDLNNPNSQRQTQASIYMMLTEFSMERFSIPKTGYYWQVGDKKYDGVGALGVKLTLNPTDAMVGDGFGWVASGRMPFQSNLVPPKYRNTLGAERFYNALNAPYTESYASAHPDAYLDPDNIDLDTNLPKPYVFPNPYVDGAPSEYIHKNKDIKPTIEGVKNASGQLMGIIADITYDTDDNDALKPDAESESKNDALKYEHSFFYIKLNIFNGQYGFDLFAHHSQTDAMTIQMREGSCNGCKFKIQAVKITSADGLESYKNPITVVNGKATGVIDKEDISDSDLDPTQQNTQTHSIWICVQKDAETLGVLMPNQSNKFLPKIGDKFNIINIDLPQSYILAAEKRLEEDGMRYMSDNNEEKFTFDIQASRIFFAENPSVLAQLDEYSKIKVKYNGIEYEQYVNQLTIDCKDNEALPNIGIDLTDTLAVGQSFVQQVAERASSLISNPYTMGGALGGGSGSGGLTTRLADLRYLKKTESDRSKGKIASDIGFEVGEYVSGNSGGIFYQDPETGQTYIETDKLKVRMKAIFEELEIAKVSTIGGKFIITPGGGINISFVEELTDSYRCYFKAKEENEKADCRLVVGDQVQCMEFSTGEGQYKNIATRYYWRKVTAVNNAESYIELSKSDRDNAYDIPSAAPMAGDTIVQLGNRTDKTRQSAIILSTVDAFAPCVTLYDGISEYSLDGKAIVEYGVDKTKNPPEPFFNCYGRFFFGPKGGNSYLKFEPSVGKLIFSGEFINVSVGGKDLDQYIKDLIPEPDLSGYDYLRNAILDGATITNGGLILSGLIALGEWDLNNEENPVMTAINAGMNGKKNHAKTIASWWGGPMMDKYYDDSVTPRDTPLATGYAQSLVRMDGSGYFAGGNIRWTESGSMTFGSGITIDLGSGNSSTFEGIGNTLASLTALLGKFGEAFIPIIMQNGTPTPTNWGSISSVDDLYAIKSAKGFYSESFISARGVNSAGSGSGNGGGGLIQTVYNSDSFGQTFDKNNNADTFNAHAINDINARLGSHIGNTDVHVTLSEKSLWNQTASNLSTIMGSDADNVINKWEEVVAFLATYTEADTLANLLSNKVDKTTKIIAGTGLTGGGTLASDPTLSLATSGVTAGTYTKLTVDAYGRATAGASLAAADIPSLDWSKITTGKPSTLAGYGITDAYTKTEADGRYVNATGDTMTGDLLFANSGTTTRQVRFMVGGSDFGRIAAGATATNAGWVEIASADDGDEPVYARQYTGTFATIKRTATLLDASGNTSFPNQVTVGSLKIGECEITWDDANGGLKFNKGIYSLGSVSARGVNTSLGGSGGGSSYNRLDSWSDYTTDKSGYVLSAGLGYDLYANKLNATKAAIEDLLTGNITTHTHSQYLTSQSLANYVTLDGSQTITGVKRYKGANPIFIEHPTSNKGFYFELKEDGSVGFYSHTNGSWISSLYLFGIDGAFKASSFVKRGGTSSQFLKADGSVDGTEYLASSSYTASDVLAKIKTVDGTGSGLDADLLDGKHNGELTAANLIFAKTNNINLNNINPNGLRYIPTVGADSQNIPTSNGWQNALFDIQLHDNGKKGQLYFSSSRIFYREGMNSDVFGDWKQLAFTDSNVASATKLSDNTAFKAWGKTFFENGKPKDVTGDMTVGGHISGVFLNIDFSRENWNYITVPANNGNLAFNIGVAGTAQTKMCMLNNGNVGIGTTAPAYKLDVNGAIRASGELISTSATALRMVQGNYGCFIRNDGSDTYMLLTASGDQYGGFNTLRPFRINNATGLVTINEGLRVNKIMIGDCTIVYENGGLKFSEGIYSEKFVSARGLNPNGSGSASSFGLMRTWPSTAPAETTTNALGANLGYELYTRLQALEKNSAGSGSSGGSTIPNDEIYKAAIRSSAIAVTLSTGTPAGTFTPPSEIQIGMGYSMISIILYHTNYGNVRPYATWGESTSGKWVQKSGPLTDYAPFKNGKVIVLSKLPEGMSQIGSVYYLYDPINKTLTQLDSSI